MMHTFHFTLTPREALGYAAALILLGMGLAYWMTPHKTKEEPIV